ncbi:purine-nucleoside phosphorylase [Robertkochia sediminum]|uniref:purine-nucleoside phosphorylase n=1 Tax=Robertkochia sediminum TaxID=2785326 RepID=UPI0019335AD0|nr:purine-nucleoside phosphorylase [Robertkochia sediminum]MBL7473036.1 purine-nucleoside phosphorylase [Robertkochia sediminum]
MVQQLEETKEYLQQRGFDKPEIGIVLGTGLGQLVDLIEDPIVAHYNHIPHFPISTVEFHKGKLIYGNLFGKKAVVMQGRFHYYEGYNLYEITYGIRAMHALGIKNLFVSNAAGALNSDYSKGEIMLLDDHINLQGGSPLAFKEVSAFGERFVDMYQPYDPKLNGLAEAIGKEEGLKLRKGVYAAVMGPQLETRAEYRYLRIIGADAVGMSTVPEVIVANQLKVPVMAISVLTDECDPDNLQPVSVDEMIGIAERTEPQMITLFKKLIERI